MLLGLIGIVSELISASRVESLPKGTRFDWEAYWKDIENGMDSQTQLKKRKKGGYYTTKPAQPKWWELPLDIIIDTERYEYDKRVIGEEYAEYSRKHGGYRQIKPFKKG